MYLIKETASYVVETDWRQEVKVTSLVLVRQVRATYLHDVRGLHDANFARNICATYSPNSRRKCCAHPPREERATRDVTF
jgi:hypothetical protein